MNIFVCVKQVPDTNEVKINPETNTLIRAGVPSILNPFDEFAMEMALRLKEKTNGKVTVISMGPDQAKEVLKQCYAMGADEMVLVSDRKFGGADTLATSYTLSSVIKKLGDYDVIFCGKQATDGDTAQVGPEIAEDLNIPQITYGVDVDYVDGEVRVKRENDDMYEIVSGKLPLLITITKTEIVPRNPNIRRKLQANKQEIRVVTAEDISDVIDPTRLGLKGSPTRVRKIFAPDRKKDGVKLEGYTPTEAVQMTIKKMKDDKAI